MNENDLVLESLRLVGNGVGSNVVDAGVVSSVMVRDNIVSLVLEFKDKSDYAKKSDIIENIKRQVTESLPGKVIRIVPVVLKSPNNVQKPIATKLRCNGVKKIIAVCSGKGGVGKSTVALHLALALQRNGYRVGIMDADVYGPSIPQMLGTVGCIPDNVDNVLMPVVVDGLQTISIGYIVGLNNALVWRGPMVTKAIKQLLCSTRWDALDYLIVDTPPGTGDIHISLMSSFVIEGVVLVSTADVLSVSDTVKSVDMLNKLGVPIVGIVVNMSHLPLAGGVDMEVFGSYENIQKLINVSRTSVLCRVPIVTNILKDLPSDVVKIFDALAVQLGEWCVMNCSC